MKSDLCGNTFCINNDKQCSCKINNGLDFEFIEQVENTNDTKLIKRVYDGCDSFKKDFEYISKL